MNEIVMPKLSDTMTEGRIVSWKKRVGETVRRGDVLAEVETDKANMELEAFTSGVLLEIKIEAGELAQVGTVIAVIGKAEEQGGGRPNPAEAAPAGPQTTDAAPPASEAPRPETAPAAETGPASEATPAAPSADQAPAATKPQPSGQPGEVSPHAEAPGSAAEPGSSQLRPEAAVQGAQPVQGIGQSAGVAPTEGGAEPGREGEKQAPAAPVMGAAESAAPREAPASGAPHVGGGQGAVAESHERAAPVVRRRARELGVDLGQVKGSGPDGRILMADLEGSETTPAGQRTTPAGSTGTPLRDQVQPLTRIRGAIARTVADSWSSIPHFSVTMDIVMDEAESLRRQLKQNGMLVTLNDVVVKGVSVALQKFPQLNASFAADGIHLHGEVNIGVAVGLPEGVLVPVIAGCQKLSLAEISQAGHRLADRARSGALGEQEMSGGTFSISNLGMYGISEFSAIIYPSQAAVLAVGAVLDAVVVRAGKPACARVMKVTLAADHRLVDGAYAAQFLAELKGILENPIGLLI